MRRQKLITNPDLGDLEEMLANVQSQLQDEIDEPKMTSLMNVQESPRPIRRSASYRSQEYQRPAPKPPLNRTNSSAKERTYESLNGYKKDDIYREVKDHNGVNNDIYRTPNDNGVYREGNYDTQSLIDYRGDRASQTSFQSFRSEPRMSTLDRMNGRSKTSTLPRGYGSTKDKNWEDYWAHEQSISSARASVMVYDDALKRWVPSGSSSGLSKVHIYHHTQHNTFRVVGRKLNDHEVVINCGIVRGLKYNQATATFHQWRDARHVYGLNFSCREDADSFARAMQHTLEVLSNKPTAGIPPVPQPNPPAPFNGHSGHYDEDMGYRTMTREDAALLQPAVQAPPQMPSHEHHYHQNNSHYHTAHHHQAAPVAPPPPPHAVPPPTHTHHRTSSAPMPPNMSLAAPPPVPPHQNLPTTNGPVPPPTPPAAPQPPPMQPSAVSSAPPPPPLPPSDNSLAAQLHQAKLKRNNKQASSPTGANSPPITQENNSGKINNTMNTMMNEMAKTLARRRAHIDKTEESSNDSSLTNTPMKTWERSATLPHRLPATCNGNTPTSDSPQQPAQSPRSVRKRFGSASEETILKQVNGTSEDPPCVSASEWDAFKQDVMREIRTQINQMKKEILDAMKTEFSRR